MLTNEGTLDRALRAIGGVILLALPFVTSLAIFDSVLAFWGALVVGVVLLGTAIFGFCPAYRLFGFKTCQDC